MREQMWNELKRESESARMMLERLPADKLDWRVHPKLRSLSELAWHMASLPLMTPMAALQGEADRGRMIWPQKPATVAQMVAGFDEHLRTARNNLLRFTDADLALPFRMMNGEQELFAMTRGEFLRWGLFSHFVHHRAQLGLHLRLLDVPVPAMIGPSMDEVVFLR